jgi:large subunit ribosomal protein L31
MKKDIHPKYGESTISCACGNVMEINSTVKEMHINTCSQCHPFYTGKSNLLDAEGRVEMFNRRYGRKSQ